MKHLHPAAHAFDVGIYFEANGHGTVLFKPSLLAQLQKVGSQLCAKLPLPQLPNSVAAHTHTTP